MTTPFGMPTFVRVGKKKTPKRLGAPGTVRPPTESGNVLTIRGTATSDSNSTTEHQLNIPDGIESGDFLIYIATIRRNAGDPEINPPSGWTLRVDGGGINTLWPAVMTKVSDGTETDTTYTTNLATDAEASAGVTIAIPAPESGWTHTIDLSSLLRFGDPTGVTAIPFPAVTLSGGSRQYKIMGAMFNIEPTGNFDVADYGAMTEVADWGGGSGNPRVQVGGVDQDTSGSYTPPDWTGDQAHNGFSLAMAIHGGGAPVASGDHTHTESDVTDLDHWTESDHDALDHTGLTGVGGGGDYYEIIVSGSAPPVAVTNEAADDFVYGLVP